MRKTLVFLFMLCVKLTFSQVNDSFDDGDFNKNPQWIGDVKLFNVNNFKELQSVINTNAQNTSLATINLLATNVKWEFDLKLTFDPSTTNKVRIYLTSSESDLKGDLNGYFIQIGESGNADSYDLYRQNGTVITKIIDGPPKNRLNANLLLTKLKITRDNLGRWELFTAIDNAGLLVLEGSTVDLGLINCSWFGVSCNYTASRSDGFFFDNFKIEELVQDVFPVQLVNVNVIDDHHIDAIFSEALEPASAKLTKNYSLSTVGNPTAIDTTSLKNVYRLNFLSALPSGNYELVTNQLKDLKGNLQTSPSSFSFIYAKPYRLKKNDLLISEVLFNPKVGGVDFVEVYNNTNQALDLKDIKLANVDAKGIIANIKAVSSKSILILPKTYWVLTTSPEIVKQSYRCKSQNQFVTMNSFPAYNNDKGAVILMADSDVIDRLDYSEKMHYALLKDADGVALERVSLLRPTNELGNFTSAAMDVGFATPTSKNSVANDDLLPKNNISLKSDTFSPDGDGFEDLLQIDYQFVVSSNAATVNIFTDRGVLVRKLQRNTSVSTSGNFTWDGLNDDGALCKVGIYIVKFEAYNLSGSTSIFRKTCVLATKLD